MSTTVHRALTIKGARRLLNDTRGYTSAQINEAELLLRELQRKRPGLNYGRAGGTYVARCENCGGANWSLHADGDDEVWCCTDCHRAPMTHAEGLALQRARAERNSQLAAEAAAAAAAALSPHEVLAAAKTKLTNTRAEFSKIEAAICAAREQVVAAQQAVDVATKALSIARAQNVRAAAEALINPAAPARKPISTTTEAEALASAEAALEVAMGAVRLLEDQLSDGRNQLHWAQYHHGNAAREAAFEERR